MQPYQLTHTATKIPLPPHGQQLPTAPPHPLQPDPEAVLLAGVLPLHALGWHGCHGYGAGFHPQRLDKLEITDKG